MSYKPGDVRHYARSTMQKAQFVTIDVMAINQFINQHHWLKPIWPKDRHYIDGPERTITARFLEAAINFCFWGGPAVQPWSYFNNGQWVGGYFGLVTALQNFFDKFPMFLDRTDSLTQLDLQDFREIFRGQDQLPLLNQRLKHWREVSLILDQRFDNSVVKLVSQSDSSASELVSLISNNFSSFQDPFLKRAQLFVADVAGVLGGKGLGYFSDLHELTAFADYKIPWILMANGILRYKPALIEKLKRHEMLPEDCTEETEIRAATIVAVDLISGELRHHGYIDAWPCWVDHWLWNQGQTLKHTIPYHRTLTTRY